MADGLRAGEVSATSGVSRKALRLYEARGIVPAPSRNASGYRLYPADTLGLLAFVGRARRLGLTLAESHTSSCSGGQARRLAGTYEASSSARLPI